MKVALRPPRAIRPSRGPTPKYWAPPPSFEAGQTPPNPRIPQCSERPGRTPKGSERTPEDANRTPDEGPDISDQPDDDVDRGCRARLLPHGTSPR
jgi:hypothetical protein